MVPLCSWVARGVPALSLRSLPSLGHPISLPGTGKRGQPGEPASPCISVETCSDSKGERNTNFTLFFCTSPQAGSQSGPQETAWLFLLLLPAFLCLFHNYYNYCGYICSSGQRLLMLSLPAPQIIHYIECTLVSLLLFNKALWSCKHCQLRFCYFRIFSLNLVAPVLLRSSIFSSVKQVVHVCAVLLQV